MRTFFCIPVAKRHREALAQTAAQLQSRTHMRASWVPRENFHVTLRFLGDIDPLLTVNLERLCRAVASKIQPFDCVLDRLGAFPSVDQARVLWVGGDMPLSFERLERSLSQGLIELGFPRARSEQAIHVTIARIKDRPDLSLPEVIKQLNPIHPISQRIDRIVLMESTLTARGAVYAPLFTTKLGEMQ